MRSTASQVYNRKVDLLLLRIKYHFGSINGRSDLTDADKTMLKKFYLEHFVAPRARKLLEKYFPEDFATDGQHPPRRTAPSPT